MRAAAAAALVSAGLAGCAAASGQAPGPAASTRDAGDPASGPSQDPPVTVYVIAGGAVVAIRAATGTPGRVIPAGTGTDAIAVTPGGTTAYAVNAGDGPDVIPINTATLTAAPGLTVGDRLRGVAVTPDGKAAYVLSYQTGTAIPISTAAGKPGAAIGLGGAGTCPTAIAITPDGKTAYVPATSYNGGTVIPISTATGTAGPPIRTGTDPLRHRDHPRGETAYVSNKARARSPRSIPPPTPQARRSPRGPAAAPSRSPPDRRHPQGRRGRHHPARTTHRPRNLKVPKACATWAKGPA